MPLYLSIINFLEKALESCLVFVSVFVDFAEITSFTFHFLVMSSLIHPPVLSLRLVFMPKY